MRQWQAAARETCEYFIILLSIHGYYEVIEGIMQDPMSITCLRTMHVYVCMYVIMDVIDKAGN